MAGNTFFRCPKCNRLILARQNCTCATYLINKNNYIGTLEQAVAATKVASIVDGKAELVIVTERGVIRQTFVDGTRTDIKFE